ncbi:MAG: hypothetical protein L6R37_008354, partial [Teloschistes peruensis]
MVKALIPAQATTLAPQVSTFNPTAADTGSSYQQRSQHSELHLQRERQQQTQKVYKKRKVSSLEKRQQQLQTITSFLNKISYDHLSLQILSPFLSDKVASSHFRNFSTDKDLLDRFARLRANSQATDTVSTHLPVPSNFELPPDSTPQPSPPTSATDSNIPSPISYSMSLDLANAAAKGPLEFFPLPGTAGAPYFDGKDISDHIRTWCQLTKAWDVNKRIERFPDYCSKDIGRYIRSLESFKSANDWDGFEEVLKEEYKDEDQDQKRFTEQYLKQSAKLTYKKKPLNSAEYRRYIHEFSAIVTVLILEESISKLQTIKVFLRGFEDGIGNKICRKLNIRIDKPQTLKPITFEKVKEEAVKVVAAGKSQMAKLREEEEDCEVEQDKDTAKAETTTKQVPTSKAPTFKAATEVQQLVEMMNQMKLNQVKMMERIEKGPPSAHKTHWQPGEFRPQNRTGAEIPREQSFRGCYGCGGTGHSIQTCEKLERYVQRNMAHKGYKGLQTGVRGDSDSIPLIRPEIAGDMPYCQQIDAWMLKKESEVVEPQQPTSSSNLQQVSSHPSIGQQSAVSMESLFGGSHPSAVVASLTQAQEEYMDIAEDIANRDGYLKRGEKAVIGVMNGEEVLTGYLEPKRARVGGPMAEKELPKAKRVTPNNNERGQLNPNPTPTYPQPFPPPPQVVIQPRPNPSPPVATAPGTQFPVPFQPTAPQQQPFVTIIPEKKVRKAPVKKKTIQKDMKKEVVRSSLKVEKQSVEKGSRELCNTTLPWGTGQLQISLTFKEAGKVRTVKLGDLLALAAPKPHDGGYLADVAASPSPRMSVQIGDA